MSAIQKLVVGGAFAFLLTSAAACGSAPAMTAPSTAPVANTGGTTTTQKTVSLSSLSAEARAIVLGSASAARISHPEMGATYAVDLGPLYADGDLSAGSAPWDFTSVSFVVAPAGGTANLHLVQGWPDADVPTDACAGTLPLAAKIFFLFGGLNPNCVGGMRLTLAHELGHFLFGFQHMETGVMKSGNSGMDIPAALREAAMFIMAAENGAIVVP